MRHTTAKETNKDVALKDSFLTQLPFNNPALVAIVRFPDLKLLFVNPPFEYYLGYSNADLAGEGTSFVEMLGEYQNDLLLNQLEHVDNDVPARSGYVIYRLKNKNGTSMPFYLYASPYEQGNNPQEKLYFLLLHPDLSKWGMPFTSFDSKELFLEQFDSEDFGTFEWIPNVDKVYISASLNYIFEIDENERQFTAESARKVIHPQDLPQVETLAKNALQSGEMLNTEFRIITGKNNIRLLHCIAKLIKGRDGKVVKFVGSLRDISEQRLIENDIKNKVEELNRSNRELEEFAYIASHDLQEPLRKVTTFSDRLSEKYRDVLTGDGQMYLKRMITASENMRNLINDLLEFSRISKNAQPFSPVSLDEVLRQAKAELELRIEETSTQIIATPLPVIDAIETQMKQLFVNIIGNAIKFQKADVPPVINIRSSVLDDKEKLHYGKPKKSVYYKIEVSDNGIGFEHEYATRIFQVFQRLHGKSEYPGTGIGLAICKKIVAFHNGIIYAESTPGEGANFIFILPEKQ
jgi:signal transduction histidine kinase